MLKIEKSRSIIAFISMILISATATAQEAVEQTIPDQAIAQSEKKELGWKPALTLGVNISFGKSDKVIGQLDGDTTTIGGTIKGSYNYTGERDEWRNLYSYTGATSETPSVPKFVKTADDLKLETIYLYSLEKHPWLGPYAKASLQTAIFIGEDVRSSAATYQVTRLDGSVTNVTAANLKLTDGFKPLTTKQSFGAFAKLIDEKEKKLETRVGFGAIQVSADDQLVLADDGATAQIEVNELESFQQAGIELGLDFSHQLDAKTKYTFAFEALIPIINDLNAGDDRNAIELTNWDAVFNISSKVYEWMAISYEFKAKKQPQLLDEVQTQHLALLNFTYSIF